MGLCSLVTLGLCQTMRTAEGVCHMAAHIVHVCTPAGTMTFGEQNTEQEAHALLSHATERGVTFFDTAELYPVPPAPGTQGLCSQYLGSWMHTQRRDRVTVASKVVGRSTGLAWIPANRTVPRGIERTPVVDADSIVAGVEGELRRLQTDYIDLLQLHWPDRYVPAFGHNQYHVRCVTPDHFGLHVWNTLDLRRTTW